MQDRIESTRSQGDSRAERNRNPSNHPTSVNLLNVAGQMNEGEAFRAGRNKKIVTLPPVRQVNVQSPSPSVIPPSPSVRSGGTGATNEREGTSARAYRDVLGSLIQTATSNSSVAGSSVVQQPSVAMSVQDENKTRDERIMTMMRRIDKLKRMAPSEYRDNILRMWENDLKELMK